MDPKVTVRRLALWSIFIALGVMVLKAKTFASGSRGFHGQGKLEVNGERLQAQCQAVVIGSKDEAKEAASE